MSDPRIAVTGANSYLGRRTVESLEASGEARILALASPRLEGRLGQGDRVETVRMDLSQPLPEDVSERVSGCDRLLHFAWVRQGAFEDVCRINREIVDRLMSALPDPSRFVFISSVSESPRTFSDYGKSKYKVSRHVLARGGSVLVCGLVMEPDPPKGPYKMLRKLVLSMPVRVRTARRLRVYPIRMESLLARLGRVAVAGLEPDAYKLFDESLPFNDFLARLEREKPGFRLPVYVPQKPLLKAVGIARALKLVPAKLSDQVLTFFFKDADHLERLREMKGPEAGGLST